MGQSRACPDGTDVVGWLQGEPLERADGRTVRLEARLPRETHHAPEVVAVLDELAVAWGGPVCLEVVATSQGRPTLGFLLALARGLATTGSLGQLVVYAGPVPVRHISALVERASTAFGVPVKVRQGRP